MIPRCREIWKNEEGQLVLTDANNEVLTQSELS